MNDNPIYVTKPFLPPLARFMPMLEEIWSSRILTNHGPYHQRFEQALRNFLEVPHVSLAANGMIALELAIEAAELSGEVITTPFSFVATAHAIRRAGLAPVFVDIRRGDLNIDAELIESAITDRTSAIVGVHCYGNPCAVEAIEGIARKHGLKVIYDAAHAFGVELGSRSLLSYGDLSTLSFHATKMFNTFEGGAVVTRSGADKELIDNLRNFGIRNEVTVGAIGSNGKMSEFNAALGLLQLEYLEQVRSARAAIASRYHEAFASIAGVDPLPVPVNGKPNFSYFPVLVTEEYSRPRDDLYNALKTRGIFSRRYFYPLLSSLPMYSNLPSAQPQNLPVADRAAAQILCLPIYPDLLNDDQERVINAIRELGN